VPFRRNAGGERGPCDLGAVVLVSAGARRQEGQSTPFTYEAAEGREPAGDQERVENGPRGAGDPEDEDRSRRLAEACDLWHETRW
jgi:hypothetical protein